MHSNVVFNQRRTYQQRMMEKMEKAGYRFVGARKHSAVKICSWCKSSLNESGHCYKQKFYGIQSSQCIQMSPTALVCSENCLFCWRPLRYTLPDNEWDEPADILNGCIEAQKDLLQGFGGNPKTDRRKFYSAMRPKHVAISLSGEPTLYPKIGGLVEEILGRKMTAFLVTNGTLPERVQELLDNGQQPTQLYVTLAAPDKETFTRTALPMFDDAWERLNASLKLLEQFRRTVIRLTLVKNLNLVNPEGYAKLVDMAAPDYLEVKAFMSVGGARERLAYELMPSDKEILEFAEKIERHSSYRIVDHKEDSRVVLLTRGGRPKEFIPGDD
jgi:tRNA wybutosine-synthesizing protein 1